MARAQALVSCPPGTWTQLTNSDTAAVSFQVLDGAIEVRGASNATPPAASARGYIYRNDAKEFHKGTFRVNPNQYAASAVRLFARPVNGRTAQVLVDHA